MTYLENDEEKAVNIINSIKDRSFLTEKEVLLSNRCIELKKIIKNQNKMIDTMIDKYEKEIKELKNNYAKELNKNGKVLKLIENDYFEDGSFEKYDEVMKLLKGENDDV